jgi:Sec-independent protein translocase protein TatA
MGELMIVLLIILGIVLMWRGPKTLPKIGEALGRGVREARAEAEKSGSEDPPTKPTDRPDGPA